MPSSQVFLPTDVEGAPLALCASDDVDPDWWFEFDPSAPHATSTWERAKRICRQCPVQAECAEVGKDEHWGIWGGKGPLERNPNRGGWPTLAPGQVADNLRWRDGLGNDHSIYNAITSRETLKDFAAERRCDVRTLRRFMRAHEARHGLPAYPWPTVRPHGERDDRGRYAG